MKLRLEDNTLRLRLSSEEVAAFHQSGRLETVVPLGLNPTNRLTYALERSNITSGSEPQITYSPGLITILLPAALADDWTGSDTISLIGSLSVFDNKELRILVEKDLGCKH